MTNYTRPVCRGSWAKGNNCRACQHCLSTAPDTASRHEVADQMRFRYEVNVPMPADTKPPRPDPERLIKAAGHILMHIYRDKDGEWQFLPDGQSFIAPNLDAAVNELNLAWQEAVAHDR